MFAVPGDPVDQVVAEAAELVRVHAGSLLRRWRGRLPAGRQPASLYSGRRRAGGGRGGALAGAPPHIRSVHLHLTSPAWLEAAATTLGAPRWLHVVTTAHRSRAGVEVGSPRGRRRRGGGRLPEVLGPETVWPLAALRSLAALLEGAHPAAVAAVHHARGWWWRTTSDTTGGRTRAAAAACCSGARVCPAAVARAGCSTPRDCRSRGRSCSPLPGSGGRAERRARAPIRRRVSILPRSG